MYGSGHRIGMRVIYSHENDVLSGDINRVFLQHENEMSPILKSISLAVHIVKSRKLWYPRRLLNLNDSAAAAAQTKLVAGMSR